MTVVQRKSRAANHSAQQGAIQKATEWFQHIESTCNRFDATSEVRLLSQNFGTAVPVSALLFHAVKFALAVADNTNGAFDPTIGRHLESQGFNRDYRTGAVTASSLQHRPSTSFRDVELNDDTQTITVHEPLLLDLGAVAKGLAIDLAARELQPCKHFLIDAGGDVLVSGCNPVGQPWAVGIRHPRLPSALLRTVRSSRAAICTSGDYERVSATSGSHHIVNGISRATVRSVASVTVVADSAMVADALSTAAFCVGPAQGLALLQQHHVEGLIVTPALEEFATAGMPRD